MSDLESWAEWFGITVKQVNRLCADGVIPASRRSPRQHWKAPFTAEARHTAFARSADREGFEAAYLKLLRPFRFAECRIHIANRAKNYAVAAAIDSALKRETISERDMDKFKYITRHWMKHKDPEAEKKDCLSADSKYGKLYRKLFPSVGTLQYVSNNPKLAELVAAFMLAINANDASTSAVISEWHKIVGQKPPHGRPRYSSGSILDLGEPDPAAFYPSQATFYRRFPKNLIILAAREAAKQLGADSIKFQEVDGDSKDIAFIFAEASIESAKAKARVS